MSIRPLPSVTGWSALAAALLLAACAAGPQTQPQFYRLKLESPQALPAPVANQASTSPSPSNGNWQLLLPLRLPEYLQRDVLWLPVGSNGLQPLEGQRWAEPLRDALPRILIHDLSQLRGSARVWAGNPPPGVVMSLQLHVEVLALEASADRRKVHLRVRWWAAEPPDPARAELAPRVEELAVTAPSAGLDADQLVAAHRLALWILAQQLVARLDSSAAPR